MSEENYKVEVSGVTTKWTYTVEEGVEITVTTYAENSFRFECENMKISGGDEINPADQVVAKEDGNNPSGGMIVGGMNNNSGSITLELTSTVDTQALLVICFGRNSRVIPFNNTHTLTVNGEKAEVSDDVIFTACEGNEWVDWTEFEICTVELKAGQTNTIVLENHAPNPSVDGCAPSGNFDYFELIPVDQSAVLTQVNAVTPV